MPHENFGGLAGLDINFLYMFQAISSLKDNLSDLGLKKTDTD